jgi:hypothetical protein
VVALQADLARIADWPDVIARERAHLARMQPDLDQQRTALTRRRDQITTERDRVLTLYARGILDEDRWQEQDAAFAARLATVDTALVALPTAPDPVAIRATGQHLASVAQLVEAAAATAPERLRDILVTTGARVQRNPAGIALRWPEAYARFLV